MLNDPAAVDKAIVEITTEKPWIQYYRDPQGVQHGTRYKPIVLVRNYLGANSNAVGILQSEPSNLANTYMMSDGDFRIPEEIRTLCNTAEDVRYFSWQEVCAMLLAKSK